VPVRFTEVVDWNSQHDSPRVARATSILKPYGSQPVFGHHYSHAHDHRY